MAERKHFLHLFETEEAFESAYTGDYYHEPWVSYVREGKQVDYNKGPIDYKKEYLTFEILSDGDIIWLTNDAEHSQKTIQYSINGGDWHSITNSEGEGIHISVLSGDEIYFRGDNTRYGADVPTSAYYSYFGSTCDFNIKGNIMSLIDSVDFANLDTFSTSQTFPSFFNNCLGVKDASNLVLPALTLRTLDYAAMFAGCTNLTSAPELPATTLANSCYSQMFFGCTNLSYIKCLATDISAGSCTSSWVDGVASSGTFVANPSTQWESGVNGIPEGWTRL